MLTCRLYILKDERKGVKNNESNKRTQKDITKKPGAKGMNKSMPALQIHS
jgi:hypothetical protein